MHAPTQSAHTGKHDVHANERVHTPSIHSSCDRGGDLVQPQQRLSNSRASRCSAGALVQSVITVPRSHRPLLPAPTHTQPSKTTHGASCLFVSTGVSRSPERRRPELSGLRVWTGAGAATGSIGLPSLSLTHSLPLLRCLYFTDPFRIPAKPLNRHLLSRM